MEASNLGDRLGIGQERTASILVASTDKPLSEITYPRKRTSDTPNSHFFLLRKLLRAQDR